MSLDAQTLLFIYVVLQIMQAALAGTLWLVNPGIGGLGWWSAGMLVGALTLPLFSLQFHGGGKIEAYLLPILATFATVAFTYIGTCRFRAIRVSWRVLGYSTAAAVTSILWFLWGSESLAARGITINLYMFAGYGATALALWSEARPLVRRTARALAGAYALGAAMMIFRVVLLVRDPEMPWATGNAAKTSGFFLGGIVLTSTWLFFVVLLINRVEAHERHLGRLEEGRAELALREALLEVERQKAARLRENLARDLHDGIGSITANLAILASLGAGEEESERPGILREIETMALLGNREIRGLLGELEGGPVDWRAFLAELRHCVIPASVTAGIATHWEVSGEIPPIPISETSAGASLAKVLREAMHNMVKHSGARTAEIRFEFGPDRLVLRIADDGCGFSEPASGGRGLRNIARRCEDLGGHFSRMGDAEGVSLLVSVPLPLSLNGAAGKEVA